MQRSGSLRGRCLHALRENDVGFRPSVLPVISFSLRKSTRKEHRYILSYEVIIMQQLPIIKHA